MGVDEATQSLHGIGVPKILEKSGWLPRPAPYPPIPRALRLPSSDEIPLPEFIYEFTNPRTNDSVRIGEERERAGVGGGSVDLGAGVGGGSVDLGADVGGETVLDNPGPEDTGHLLVLGVSPPQPTIIPTTTATNVIKMSFME